MTMTMMIRAQEGDTDIFPLFLGDGGDGVEQVVDLGLGGVDVHRGQAQRAVQRNELVNLPLHLKQDRKALAPGSCHHT